MFCRYELGYGIWQKKNEERIMRDGRKPKPLLLNKPENTNENG